MSKAPTTMPEPTLWQAEQLRLTVFPVDPETTLDRDWWQQAFGQPADTSMRKKLLRTDEGVIGENAVSLTIDPQRIAWRIGPVLDPLNPPPSLPTLGPLPQAISTCGELFDRVLDCLPDVRRIAFGAILLQPVEGHEAGYRLLDGYLPEVHVSPEASDFQYRVNRRRNSRSGIDGLYINRLSTWSLLRWEIQARTRSASEGALGRVAHKGKGFACRAELDINTPAEREDPLPKDQLRWIWLELIDLAVEIATCGDIP